MGTTFECQNGNQVLVPKSEPICGSNSESRFWFQIGNQFLVPELSRKTVPREPVLAVPAISILGISGCAVWGFFGSEKWQIWATRGRRKECARWALREALGAPLPERAPTVCGARGGRGLILSARTLQLILWRAAFVETLALCVYERGLQPTSPRPFDKMRCDYSRSTHHCVAVAT